MIEEMAEEDIVVHARAAGAPVYLVGSPVVKAMSASVTPQGIVAVAASPLTTLTTLRRTSGIVVVLAAVGDPGNVGTLIRTGAAGGVDGVVLTRGCADPLNPKTVRASAAALFTVPVVADVDLASAIDHLRSMGYRIGGLDAEGPRALYDTDLTVSLALVLGNEAWGLPGDGRGLLDDVVSIPMPGRVDSLNVATAGSIVLFESLRQRKSAGAPRLSSSASEEAP